jgi:hypothetical protein
MSIGFAIVVGIARQSITYFKIGPGVRDHEYRTDALLLLHAAAARDRQIASVKQAPTIYG